MSLTSILAIAIAIAEGIAHQEKEVIVPVKVDPDLIADPEKNIKTIASIGTIDHAHITKNINPTPEIDIIHLIKSITTIDKDPEATLMPNTKTTTEIDPLKEENTNNKKDQTAATTHFTQKLMLSI